MIVDISSPNDSLARKILENPRDLSDFLHGALSPEILACLDMDSLEIVDTQYVSNELNPSHSDVVARTRTRKEEGRESSAVDIYVLIEHKSTPEKRIFVQLLGYMRAMFEEDVKSNVPPRIILPLVFYHGRRKWRIPLFFQDCADVPAPLKPHVLNFSYTLYDISVGRIWRVWIGREGRRWRYDGIFSYFPP